MRRTTGTIVATTFVGQVAGMAGFVSFPALQPEFQRLWTQSDSEAGFISGIYFVGYVIAVPLASGLTDRVEARRVYLTSLLFGVVGALGVCPCRPGSWVGSAVAVSARGRVRWRPYAGATGAE
jgi:MFS family permease